MEDDTYIFYQGCHNDLERFSKCDISQLIDEKEEYLAQRTGDLEYPLFHRNHEIYSKYDSFMSRQFRKI